MARSYRHTPACSVCGGSNKWARTNANRKLRRFNKVGLASLQEEFQPKNLREVSCTWAFPTDGLAYYREDLTVEGNYYGMLRNIKKSINKDGYVETRRHKTRWTFGTSEGLLDWLKLPRTINALLGVTNKQVWEYATYLYKTFWVR